jgi:hypothetical protein
MVELQRPPMGTMANKRRIIVPLTEEEFEHINQVAWKHRTSVSVLGHIAVLQLLLSAAKGEFSLVPEFQPDREIPRA